MSRLSAVEAVQGLVDSARAAAWDDWENVTEESGCGSCNKHFADCDASGAFCPGPLARRALAAFASRAPIAEDHVLFHLVDNQLRFCAETEPLLDAIDRALLGATDTKGDR